MNRFPIGGFEPCVPGLGQVGVRIVEHPNSLVRTLDPARLSEGLRVHSVDGDDVFEVLERLGPKAAVCLFQHVRPAAGGSHDRNGAQPRHPFNVSRRLGRSSIERYAHQPSMNIAHTDVCSRSQAPPETSAALREKARIPLATEYFSNTMEFAGVRAHVRQSHYDAVMEV